jgi:hypothetical protein
LEDDVNKLEISQSDLEDVRRQLFELLPRDKMTRGQELGTNFVINSCLREMAYRLNLVLENDE